MSLTGLSHVTIGVPDAGVATSFYEEFGLRGVGPDDRGKSQLKLKVNDRRGLLELGVWANDLDDLHRAARATGGVSKVDDDAVMLSDPVTGMPVKLSIHPLDDLPVSRTAKPDGHPVNQRAEAVYRHGPVTPQRLGHVVIGTPDKNATSKFLQETVGFTLTESRGEGITFLRCDTDHHNIALVDSPRYFLHHTSWQVEDVDEVIKGGQRLVAVDPTRDLWGPGRHFYGSNYFWYFRDPAGHFAEYFSDMDEITDQEVWAMKTAGENGGTHVWGPKHPHDFKRLSESDDLVYFEA